MLAEEKDNIIEDGKFSKTKKSHLIRLSHQTV